MRRGYRFAGRPPWVAGHLVVLALAVAMIFLGRWQLHVSESKGFSLQNFGYALQWWVFSVFTVLFWGRIVRDHGRGGAGSQPAEPEREPDEPVTYRRYVMPQSAQIGSEPADAEHAAYNEYLAQLAQQPETEQR